MAEPKLRKEDEEKLADDNILVCDFKQRSYESQAQQNWDKFYKRNTTKFFRDRHWTKREFTDLWGVDCDGPVTLLEAGCGVGNFMFPLLEDDDRKAFKFYACDFSPRAVEFIKSDPKFDASCCTAFQSDLTSDDLTLTLPRESVDIATLIFVLSSIHPDKMAAVLTNISQVLKPGGVILLRDYGVYDYAMLRFSKGHKLQERFYVRQDGTRAYYFTTGEIVSLAQQTGYQVITNEYIHRETTNRKEELSVHRVFIQTKLQKN